MRRPRVSILTLMATVGIAAVDIAVIRALGRGPKRFVSLSNGEVIAFIVLALGVLPMASLLLVGATDQLSRAIRRGTISGFAIGFEVAGWSSIFAFLIASALSPESIHRILASVVNAVGPIVVSAFDQSTPPWVFETLELLLIAVVFLVPELLIAAAGGWLVKRSCNQLAIAERRSDVLASADTGPVLA